MAEGIAVAKNQLVTYGDARRGTRTGHEEDLPI
jgi:hypothetical protein